MFITFRAVVSAKISYRACTCIDGSRYKHWRGDGINWRDTAINLGAPVVKLKIYYSLQKLGHMPPSAMLYSTTAHGYKEVYICKLFHIVQWALWHYMHFHLEICTRIPVRNITRTVQTWHLTNARVTKNVINHYFSLISCQYEYCIKVY